MEAKGNKISRGSFLRMGTAGIALALAASFSVLSSNRQSGPSIKEIIILPVPGEFYRPIAMNAYDKQPKGKAGVTKLVRVVLDDGTEGVGVEGYRRIDEDTIKGLKKMIGVSLNDIYDWDNERIVGFSNQYSSFFQNPKFAFFESPILDALGKTKDSPVWQLFGSKVRPMVDCYDGTLYFKDIELNTDVSVLADLAKSEIGKLMSIHAAMIKKNIGYAEDDRYHNLALDASGYLFREGKWAPPELPGWGLKLNENYAYFKKHHEEQVIS